MTSLERLRVKIFADGAELDGIGRLYANPLIQGFTTNPTLMRKAGVEDYESFARAVLALVPDRPVSFEVFADDFALMEEQAFEIASWGPNVYVKIPITNTRRESAAPLVARLSEAGVALNVTALLTLEQVAAVARALDPRAPAIVSVFAGRIADTGRDPVPLMREARSILASRPKAELLWASPREVLNILHAEHAGCHIITVTHDMLAKLGSIDKDLDQLSLETVQMFHRDAATAGYRIGTAQAPRAAGRAAG